MKILIMTVVILFGVVGLILLLNFLTKGSLKAWWARNVQKSNGAIDTSRVMKLAITVFVVCFMAFASVIFIVIAWQFFFTKGKLIMKAEEIKVLAYAVGSIITLVGVDYRIGRNGKG